MRQTVLPFVVAAALLLLLGILGTLQYRWLGAVSDAERDRLRNGLRTRAAEFAQEFDRELMRVYLDFQLESAAVDRDAAAALGAALDRAQARSTSGRVVREVYVCDSAGGEQTLRRFEPGTRTLERVEWPTELWSLRGRALHTHVVFSGTRILPPFISADAIDADAPALVVPVTFVREMKPGDRPPRPEIGGTLRSVIVWLDADWLRRELLDALVAKYFGADGAAEYVVSVVTRTNPPTVIYSSAKHMHVLPQSADVAAGLFDLRLDEVPRMVSGPAAEPPPGTSVIKDRVAITIVRRADGDGRSVLTSDGDRGAWQLLIRAREGSLESVVARSRRRNLAIGLGILGLLAASFVFVIGSAQRQQRLARQQMEFVAAVSHELRTPLAVIRSAGENLADGVVADGDQVKRYGTLIGAEGRRLSDMVERVMEFAGIASSAPPRMRPDVDVAGVVASAAAGVEADARERGVTLAVESNGSLPAIVGDADALRSAVQNIIGNAVKYSPGGATVEVRAERTDDGAGGIRICVADRGLGIDEADLPHIFKPFYRGRRAVDAQIRGTGVGLSVVRHVVDAHQGRVTVASRDGGGTVVTMTLVPPPLVPPKPVAEPSGDGGPKSS